MKSKISVIIPCYNTAKYIEVCLNSLIRQTIFSDLEIICIDDGSIDNTFEILHQYSLVYQNIKIIRQINQGQSAARNLGVQNSSGSYMSFVDSDDYVNETFYEDMLSKMTLSNSDMVVCTIATVYDSGEIDFSNAREYLIDDFKQIDELALAVTLFLRDRLSVSPCNKLIKKEILTANNMTFPIGLFNEDVEFAFDLYSYCSTVAKCDTATYFYRQRINSTTKLATNRVLDMLKVVDNISLKLDSRFPNKYRFEMDSYKLLFCIYLTLHRIRSSSPNVRIEVIRQVHQYSKTIGFMTILRVDHSLRKKCLYLITKYFPYMLNVLLK